ncbi:MAG: S-layer homology domain-containing protein [Firmicutes bacterium]|nr:S-layer homology domain-containing protein [Bacillota bacterium]
MKKITASLLSLAMILSALAFAPAAAFAEDDEIYVLMNIPYGDFYGSENAVDALSSATLAGKARNVNVNGASYHQSEAAVKEEGIAGVTYPVKTTQAQLDALLAANEGAKQVTDADEITYEMNVRGTMTTFTLSGSGALQEAPSYSYYVLSEAPSACKTMTVENGKPVFEAAEGSFSDGEVTAQVKAPGGHTSIEFTLEGAEIAAADVSAVTVTTASGTYALHHVTNIWRGTELGWDLTDLDLGGETITSIRYYMKDGSVTDYSTQIAIPDCGYVLMNIPYGEFYEAEGISGVDGVTSATKSKTRAGNLAAGTYHKDPEGSDISGITFPVFVSDMSVLEGLTQVTDDASLSITVTLRGQESTTVYEGRDALFENADHAYYLLSEKPARCKALTVKEDGSFSFGPVGGRAASKEGAEASITYNGHHTDIEISLENTEGIEKGDAVSAVVLTDSEGNKYGLHHVTNIWRGTELGWNEDELDMAGKTITNVRYYTTAGITDYPVNIQIKEVGKQFTDVNYQSWSGDAITYVAKNGIFSGVETETFAPKKVMTRGMAAQVLLNMSGARASAGESAFTDVTAENWYCAAVNWAASQGIIDGYEDKTFKGENNVTREQLVAMLYRFAEKQGKDVTANAAAELSFEDASSVKDYAQQAMKWAVGNGLIEGDGGRLSPGANATREQVAMIMMRFSQLMK